MSVSVQFDLYNIIVSALCIYSLISIGSYAGPALIQWILPTQNLKEKYQAKWALVTGGSQGIGQNIVKRLAQDGINVVVVALDNEYLHLAMDEFQVQFPNRQFRSVGVNLAQSQVESFMPAIIDATQDLDISLVFNNAGYMQVGMFVGQSLSASMSNFNVNATSIMPITHHFVRLMITKGIKGFVCFTSSSGIYLPSPMASMYASTKQFVTRFGASLAAELSTSNVDVLVVHPSPIASNFFNIAKEMSAISNVKAIAQPPSVVSDVIWKNAGRFVVVEQGIVSVALKMLTKLLDFNILADLFRFGIHVDADFKKFKTMQDEALFVKSK
jgi:short-subunit dehydrogenase